MPFMTNGKRNYKAELNWEKKKKPNRVKDRAKRNAARKKVGLKVGDPRQVDHKKSLLSGGGNGLANLFATSAKANLTKEANRKKRMARKKEK